ncbi:hypothetical protein BGZ49_009647 [Haplosporangium sp. Z 27]|nr:hypothetical protein BGZ49_009647 [Haplosporangium sp. Z 27]
MEARLQREREERARLAQQQQEERERVRLERERQLQLLQQERAEARERERLERIRRMRHNARREQRAQAKRIRRQQRLRRQHEQRRMMRRYITGDIELCMQRMQEDAQKSLDSTPTPVRQPIPMSLDGIVQEVHGLSLKAPTIQQILLAQNRFSTRQQLEFYSDGSLINQGSEQVSMAFGVVVKTDEGAYEHAICGRVAGYASSALAELCGLLATILISPRNVPILVHIDNSSVVHNFQELVKDRESTSARQRLRSANAQWWTVIYQAYRAQGGMVRVQWVRGHAGNIGNSEADTFAKTAHRRDTGLWMLDPQKHLDMLCHVQFAGHTVDQDVRQVLKLQSAVRHHHQWMSQNRTREYVRNCESIAWTSTLRIVHNNNPLKTGYTSTMDSALRLR